MGIWIRSQNREYLIDADIVYCSSSYALIRGNYILYKSEHYTYLLGEYSTKGKP